MRNARFRWVVYLLLFTSGGVLGVSVSIGALYERPFRDQFEALKRRFNPLGVRYSRKTLYETGADKADRPLRWNAIESPTHPEWKVAPGYDVRLVAEGFTYPVNIAFATHPGDDPDSPVFYVTELDGRIQSVGQDGQVRLFAEGFKNLPPIRQDRSDEIGLIGLTSLADSEDLIITHSHLDPESGMLINRIVRLVSEPGGKAMSEARTLLELDERTAPSHQIQSVVVGPDGKLYVAVGDALTYTNALDRSKFAGKILRMNLDGSPCEDNPFFEDSPEPTPRHYIYAYGLRNVFDMAFQPGSGRLYASENGQNTDRLIEVVRGASYGWDGLDDSSRLNALLSWGPQPSCPSPVGLIFLNTPVLGEASVGRFFVGMYGKHATDGPGENVFKSIVEAGIDPQTGLLMEVPRPIVQYNGPARATVLGLAEGPDGIYFTDFYGTATSIDAQGAGRVWKLVPSQETLGLPPIDDEFQLAALEPEQRGAVLFQQYCTSCHSLDGRGGREGPKLDSIATILNRRLKSPAYETSLKKILADGAPSTGAAERIEEILSLETGDPRTRAWLRHHLEDPRFDNFYAKMPSFEVAFSEEQRDDVIQFLMQQE